jgi:ligand-binding sensor domain-containing protein/serine phosphatase RsbU (regulator of sigma subunit)
VGKRYHIALVSILYAFSIQAQLQVKNFFSLTGKKNVPVHRIIQDNNGYLWLGASEGVYKFDGREAIALAKDYPVLKQEISALYMDEKEAIWIGTKSGKVYFLSKNKLDSLDFSKHPNSNKITSFYYLNKQLWIGTYGSGIYCLDKSRELSHFDTEKGLSDNVIYTISGNKKDRLWCGTDAGITEISVGQEAPQFRTISDKNGLPDNIVRDIFVDENRLLIAMQDSGICYYDLEKGRIERNHFFTNWSLGAIINARQQALSKLIIGTEKNGLLVFEKGGVFAYDYPKYIQTEAINQLFVDREKQLWLASRNGISQLTSKRYHFINTGKGLSTNEILALAVDNDRGIWLGTTMGISKLVSDDEGKLIITNMDGLKKNTISCATKAPDGNIWFGTYGSGIIIMSAETNRSVILNARDEKLANDNISHIYFADDNTVYISTLGGGLIKARVELNGAAKLFNIEKTFTEEEGLGSNYVYAAITDATGKLYIATDGGGLQVLEGNKFVDLTKRYNLASSTVFSLCKDKYNNIWATSNANGILKYNGNSIKTIRQADGIRDEQPAQLISTDNTLFAFNSKGIDKIDCQTGTVSYYDLFDGDLEPNLNAVFFSDNTIYSGTNNGMLTYRTGQEPADSIKPLVFIKAFQLNYKPFPMDSTFEFKYDQNNMTFTFEGIWLKNPDKLAYRYRLQGLESDWQYSNEGKAINYNNLGPGNYIFIVQVKNEEDVWSDPTGYAFIILTPVWKRWWFWVLVVSLVSAGVYTLIRYRLKALQRENLILEQRVKERTHQIERQSQIIIQKNKDITDSITYARKIQHAILPDNALIKTHLPHSFVLYMTKDIVSGDFYWFSHLGSFSIIAAVDCTGHGVPGAFMSLIGYNLLNKIVNEQDITEPEKILLHLNLGVLEALYKNESESKDGMDVAICRVNHDAGTLQYAGAMRPLWIINNGELREIKADKIPIGTRQRDREETIAYTGHTMPFVKGDSFYIFTDGYADQFGGPKDKKYSSSKFKELLLAHSGMDFNAQEKNIRAEHLSWKGENEQVDDILLIGFGL